MDASVDKEAALVAPFAAAVSTEGEAEPTSAPEKDPASAPTSAPVRPPNRPAHEKYLEEVGARLAQLEGRRRFLQDRAKGLREQLGRCRADRDAITEERNRVEERLSGVNREVSARSEQLQKLRQGIPYLSEDRIDEQIRTLEDQMMKHHYKRTEENKIITEVNRLKRSKKALKEHNSLKVRAAFFF